MTEGENYGRVRVEDYEPRAKTTIPVEPYTTTENVVGWIIILVVSFLICAGISLLALDAVDAIDLVPFLDETVGPF